MSKPDKPTETAGIRYAYLRDPLCNLRVVTIAYTVNPESQPSGSGPPRRSVTYAFAINRIDAYKHHPQRIKNHKTSELHRKGEGRDHASYRLINIGKTTVSHCYVAHDQRIIETIVADHLEHHKPATRKKPIPRNAMYLQKVYEVFKRIRELTPPNRGKITIPLMIPLNYV